MTKQTLSTIENLAAANTRMVESYNAAAKTLATAYCKGVEALKSRERTVKSVQEYHKGQGK